MEATRAEIRQLLGRNRKEGSAIEIDKGEKLYVTADKRGEKGGCKRPLCWTLLGLVVIAIVALIVLAATGILFSNSPTALEQYNASVSSARAFGGITGDHSHNHDHDHDHDHSNHEHDHSNHNHEQEQSTSPPQSGTQSQNDEAQLPMVSEETGDASMYVPRTLEGTLKIDNEIFTSDLEDTESEKYRDFTTTFSDALKHALFNRNTLENGDNEIIVEVIQIRNGSLIVTYRIHWMPKHNGEPTEDLLTTNTLKTNLNNYLIENNRMINVYHIAEEDLPTSQVLDLCKINNYECEYKCEFDDSTLDFTCVCPHGQVVDMRAPKRCMPLFGNSEQDNTETEIKNEMNPNLNESTSNSEEKVVTEKNNVAYEDNIFDWKEPRHNTPETTTETDADMNFSHIFGPETPKPEPEPSAEPEAIPIPEPTLTPKLEGDSDAETESKPEPTAEPQAEPTPEPTAEPKPEPAAPEPIAEPNPEVEPTPLPTTEPKPEPEPVPEPTSKPNFKLEPAPEPTAEPKPEPEPTAEPNPAPEPTTSANLDPQPNPEPEPGSSTEIQQELEPISEPQPDDKITSEEDSSPETTISTVTMIPPKDILDSSRGTIQNEPMQPNTTPKQSVPFDHPIFDLESIIGLHTTAEPESNQETEDNLEIKPLDINESANQDMEKISTTTARISLSEPKIVNEPSYEPKPEIISILTPSGQRMNFTSIDPSNYTTPESDWLEADDEKNNISIETTTRNINDQMDSEINNEGSSEHLSRPEQRSSKKFENFDLESTTNINDNNNEDITFDLIKQNNEMPPIFTTTEPTNAKIDNSLDQITFNKNNEEITTFANTFTYKMDYQKEKNEVTVTEIPVENATTVLTQNIVGIRSNVNETSPAPEYSINKQFEGSEGEKNLMEVYNINKTSNNMWINASTEKNLPEESTDVSFENINMLYNRSSKSIDKTENKTMEVTELNEESAESTTDSDWLSETVTEINYDDVMNKIEKQETTETSVTKIDEIMGSGVNKDDFEPDYLNNMGSKTSKLDEPVYSMSQDYDSEDSRFKRVNMDKDKSQMAPKGNITEITNQEEFLETNLKTNAAHETTTIGQYIYKVSQQNINEAMTNTESSSTTSGPAPVWEESEGAEDLSVKELPHKIVNVNNSQIEDARPTSTTLSLTSVSPDLNQDQDNSTRMSDLIAQNTTMVNNLNVTIYEISSHSGNQSYLSSKSTNSPSSDFVDHETEMNPFLPEVENNKSLVKKLQEGHDIIEPPGLNETQNENVEEHNPSNTETPAVSSNQTLENNVNQTSNATLLSTPKTEAETTTAAHDADDDFLFNQLFTNSHEQESEFTTEINKILVASNKDKTVTTETNDNKEVLPISTFLLDTDDLDTTKKPTVTENGLNPSFSNDLMTSNPVKDTNSEFLSVVPIEQENSMQTLKKDYNSESSQELNFISDSPKKSDRRTIDVNNLDSVLNNVA